MNGFDRAWNEFFKTHITPARCSELGWDLQEMTTEEVEHLKTCDRCRAYYECYYQFRHLVTK